MPITVTQPVRIIDLNKLSEREDAHLLRQVIYLMYADLYNIAEKLNAEASLSNKSYVQGLMSKYR